MRDKTWSPSTLFDIFGDAVARDIIRLAAEDSVSAETLAADLDVSRSTVYRRTNQLIEYGLLSERQHVDEDGSQYKLFTTRLKRITFEIDNDSYEVSMQMHRRLTDQFEAFWTELERSSSNGVGDGTDSPDVEHTQGDPS